MSERPRPKKVFLDANAVIRERNLREGLLLGRLKDLVDDGVISVLTTDLTCQQVAKKHAENDYGVIKEVRRPHFRRIVKEVLGTTLPETTSAELKAKLTGRYSRSTEAMFKELRCKKLVIDAVEPSTVFSAYIANEGFFTGEGKRNQFADAFIFECLKSEASREEPVIIVSDDKDFIKPVESEAHISLVKSLPDLFETLGLQVEEHEITDFLEHQEEELVKAVNNELVPRSLRIGDIEEADVEEMEMIEVGVSELTNFGSTQEGGPILVVGHLSGRADVSYFYLDLGSTEWEEDRYIDPVPDTVIGSTEISFEAEVSISVAVDKNRKPESIERVEIMDFCLLVPKPLA